MATIAIVLRADKLNKKGESPIHFRIIKHRRISYISTGIYINPKFWDEKRLKVKPGVQNSARLNSFITNKFAELQDKVFEHETISRSITTRQLKDRIYGKHPTDFFAFANKALERYLRDEKFATHDKCKSIIKKIKDYWGTKELTFYDITPQFLEDYEYHLRKQYGNSTNTIHKDLKFIRKLFNDAYREDLIEYNHIPFNKYKLKTEKTTRVYLSEEELKRFEECKIEEGSKIKLAQDMFVFSAYAGGVRVSDLLQLKWNNYTGTHINFTIKKTKSQLSIKLPNKAISVIEKYRPEKLQANTYIFPMLKNSLNEDNLRELDKAISGATALLNKNLKQIAQKSGIERMVSFHISRHTWATRALLKGMSIDKVSKLMGHSALKETQIYAKIVSEELDNAMELFN